MSDLAFDNLNLDSHPGVGFELIFESDELYWPRWRAFPIPDAGWQREAHGSRLDWRGQKGVPARAANLRGTIHPGQEMHPYQ